LRKHKRRDPMLWGLVGYLSLFIIRPFEYWEWLGAFHIERVYMICLLIAMVLWKGKRYVHHPIHNAFIAFFLVMCASILIAYRPEAAIWHVEEYFKLLVLYFVIILTIQDEEDFRFLIISFIVITGIYVGKSLWEFIVHGRHVYRMGISRLVGMDQTYNDPNTFAATIVYSLPFAWALWKSEKSKWMGRGLLGYGAMCVVAIMFTGSRSGMLSFLFFLGLIWMKHQKKIFGLVLLALGLLAIWQFVPGEYKVRYFTIFDDSISATAAESAQGRIDGLKNGFKLFANSPFLGWGAGNFIYAVETIGVFNRLQSHNLYGQLVADLGLLGVIPFLAICWLMYRTYRKIQKASSSCLKAGLGQNPVFMAAVGSACLNTLLLLLFQGNFGHNLYRYTWLVIGAILVLGQILVSKRPNPFARPPLPKSSMAKIN
jgi:O-antigen ligase